MSPKFGFGGYRLDSKAKDSSAQREALKHAILRGCKVIDTSPNYANGGSEELIGQVLQDLPEMSTRSLTICTKVGVIQGLELTEAREREAIGKPWAGVVKLSNHAWYCIHPEYINYSVSESTRRLGCTPDAVLLHNPEFILSHLLNGEGVNASTATESVRDRFYHPSPL